MTKPKPNISLWKRLEKVLAKAGHFLGDSYVDELETVARQWAESCLPKKAYAPTDVGEGWNQAIDETLINLRSK